MPFWALQHSPVGMYSAVFPGRGRRPVRPGAPSLVQAHDVRGVRLDGGVEEGHLLCLGLWPGSANKYVFLPKTTGLKVRLLCAGAWVLRAFKLWRCYCCAQALALNKNKKYVRCYFCAESRAF